MIIIFSQTVIFVVFMSELGWKSIVERFWLLRRYHTGNREPIERCLAQRRDSLKTHELTLCTTQNESQMGNYSPHSISCVFFLSLEHVQLKRLGIVKTQHRCTQLNTGSNLRRTSAALGRAHNSENGEKISESIKFQL